MKVILMSIQSKHLVNILNGKETIELRKKFPSDYRGWVYAYCTLGRPYLYECALYSLAKKGECAFVHNDKDEAALNFLSGKVVCRFWVDNVETIYLFSDGVFATKSLGSYDLLSKSRVLLDDFISYFNINERIFNHNIVCYHLGFAIHFSKLEIFDKPKELREFSVERYAEMPNGVFPCYEPITKAPQSWQYIYIEEII